MSRPGTLVLGAAFAGMLCVAGAAAGRIYSGDLALRLALGAAVLPVLASLLTPRRWAVAAAPLSVLCLAGYLAFAVRVTAASGQVPGGLGELALDALRNGVPRLLSAMLPVEPQPDTVLVPVIAIWVAGLAGAELAIRAGRVLSGLLAPLAGYAAALYLVGPHGGPRVWEPLAFTGCAALALAVRAPARGASGPAPAASAAPPDTTASAAPPDTTARTSPPHRATGAAVSAADAAASEGTLAVAWTRSFRWAVRCRAAAATGVSLAAVLALTAAVAPAVAGRVSGGPVDPRRYVVPPQLDALDESPLARLSGWALTPQRNLFELRMSGAVQAAPRIRLAVLADYDGVTWRVGASYRPAGRVLAVPETAPSGDDAPPAGPAGAAGAEVTQRITVEELDGRLVPAVADPRRVDGVRVAFDPQSGTLALPDGLAPGLRYTVVSRERRTQENLLPAADVPSGPAVARYLGLGTGPPPEELGRLAQQIGQDAGTPYTRATAIAQFLGDHYRLVTDAPSGHAYPNLRYFLFGPRAGGGQRGATEQFATAFAVLARILGIPSRVVVGFRPAADATEVRARDALAWPEVMFAGVGWVAFDPLPQGNAAPRPVEADFAARPSPSTAPPASVPPPAASASPPRPAPTGGSSLPGGGSPAVRVAAGGAVTALLLGYLLGVPVLRGRRRYRRLRRGTPAQRVIGAWHEVLDGLRLAGRAAPPQLAVTEVAGHAQSAATGPEEGPRVTVAGVDELAVLVNRAAFADGAVDEADAHRAVAQAIGYVGELRSHRPWWGRLAWNLDPRPLGWPVRRSRLGWPVRRSRLSWPVRRSRLSWPVRRSPRR